MRSLTAAAPVSAHLTNVKNDWTHIWTHSCTRACPKPCVQGRGRLSDAQTNYKCPSSEHRQVGLNEFRVPRAPQHTCGSPVLWPKPAARNQSKNTLTPHMQSESLAGWRGLEEPFFKQSCSNRPLKHSQHDIARGRNRLMAGLQLCDNFQRPSSEVLQSLSYM